jgi:hypothetical protein
MRNVLSQEYLAMPRWITVQMRFDHTAVGLEMLFVGEERGL